MKHRIFLSYSTKDQAAAEEICRALESQGLGCWIAPRDIAPGSQWGGSIVGAIEGCEAVLVLFSDASNNSPQVAREMEVAVAQRRPLIPVRIANAMPTDDMKYFLGVSHWLNAYERPLPTYLPEIVAATRRVLDKETSPLSRVMRVLPKTRNGQIMMGGVAIVAVAVLTASLMRQDPMGPVKMENPMTGRWEASLPTASGEKVTCVMDVQPTGQAHFSDTCPPPLTAGNAGIATAEGSTWAPSLFQSGDTGTFLFQGGTLHGGFGAYRLKGKRLIIRDTQFGEVSWKRKGDSAPLKNALDDMIPAPATWPLEDMPQIAAKATAYARSHWQPDAVLMTIEAKLLEGSPSYTTLHAPAGSLEVRLSFYSPNAQEGLNLTPGATYGGLSPMGSVDWDANQALPSNFMDLPAAFEDLKRRGLRGKQIKSAELRNWSRGSSAGGAQLGGIQWMIDSNLDERGVVNAGLE